MARRGGGLRKARCVRRAMARGLSKHSARVKCRIHGARRRIHGARRR